MERLGGLRRYAVVALQIVGVGVAYYATSWLGFLSGIISGQVSPLWPATGIALVAFLFFGVRVWPAILVGAFLSELSFIPWQPALLTGIGNVLAPLCAYFLLRRVGFRINLDRLRRRARAGVPRLRQRDGQRRHGTTVQLAYGITPPSLVVPTAFTWWTGDVMGVLVVAPLLLALYQVRSLRAIRNASPRRLLEGTALVVGSAAIVLVSQLSLGAGFIAFPLIVLAAWRFRLLGATLVVAVASMVEIYAAIANVGAFADRDLLGQDDHPADLQRIDRTHRAAARCGDHRTRPRPAGDRTNGDPARRGGKPSRAESRAQAAPSPRGPPGLAGRGAPARPGVAPRPLGSGLQCRDQPAEDRCQVGLDG